MAPKPSTKAEWTQLANDIGQTALGILSAPLTLTEKRFRDPKALAFMLMARSLSHLRGVFTLVDAGLIVEARVLVRCCLENGFWVEQLLAEGDKFVRKMAADEARSRKVRGELAMRRKEALTDEASDRLRAQLRAINKGWPDAESLNPKAVALNGVLAEGYLLYSQLSADAAHPTVTSLARHVVKDNGETVIDVEPTSTEQEIVMTLDWACNAMLGVAVGVNQILGNTPAGQGLRELGDRYHALTTGRKAA
jgi:hypothetical protein